MYLYVKNCQGRNNHPYFFAGHFENPSMETKCQEHSAYLQLPLHFYAFLYGSGEYQWAEQVNEPWLKELIALELLSKSKESVYAQSWTVNYSKEHSAQAHLTFKWPVALFIHPYKKQRLVFCKIHELIKAHWWGFTSYWASWNTLLWWFEDHHKQYRNHPLFPC